MRKILTTALIVTLAIGMGLALTPQVFATWGDTGTFLGRRDVFDGRKATEAYLNNPEGMAIDPNNGDIYIADTKNNRIAKIDWATRTMSTHVNVTNDFGQTDGFRLLATLGYPEDIAIDRFGVLYVADTMNHAVRKIDGDTITTIASEGLSYPAGITVRGDTVFVADTGHNRVVAVHKNGGPLTMAAGPFNAPKELFWSGTTVYTVNQGDGTIGQIDLTTGASSRYMGGFRDIGGAAMYGDNTMYVADGEQGVWNQINKVTISENKKEEISKDRETELLNWAADIEINDNRLFILYKGGSSLYSYDMDAEDERREAGRHRYAEEFGPSSIAQIGRPHALVWNNTGNMLYFMMNNQIGEFNLGNSEVRSIAGNPMDNYVEGVGSAARFSDPTQLAISPDNKTLYLPDRNNHRIRSFNLETKETHYLTGAGAINYYQADYEAYQEGGPCPGEEELGVAGCAYFNRPTGIAINPAGTKLYVADAGNNRIREVDIASGRTRTLAGDGTAGLVNGFGPYAKFNGPFNLGLDSTGRYLYITDKNNHAIRKLDLETLNVTTVIGTSGRPGYAEGTAANALLHIPEGITIRANGDIYWTEAGSLRVRMYTQATGITRLVSGSGTRGRLTGPGAITRFNGPKGIAFNPKDGYSVYVCDFYNDSIKVIRLR